MSCETFSEIVSSNRAFALLLWSPHVAVVSSGLRCSQRSLSRARVIVCYLQFDRLLSINTARSLVALQSEPLRSVSCRLKMQELPFEWFKDQCIDIFSFPSCVYFSLFSSVLLYVAYIFNDVVHYNPIFNYIYTWLKSWLFILNPNIWLKNWLFILNQYLVEKLAIYS